MSGGTSSITLIVGNLGADPELKYTPNGGGVLNLSVATSVAWTDKSSGKKQSETEWHRCVLFGLRAENAAKYLKKGSKVHIRGRNRTRKWQDKDGVDRYTTEVMADDIQYLDRAPESGSTANVGNASDAAEQIQNDVPLPEYEDDIPF